MIFRFKISSRLHAFDLFCESGSKVEFEKVAAELQAGITLGVKRSVSQKGVTFAIESRSI